MSGDDLQPYLGCFFPLLLRCAAGGVTLLLCHRSVAPCGACPPVWGIKLREARCRLSGHERRFRKQWPSCWGPPVANGCDYVFGQS